MVLKNLWRRRTRTLLTLAGITVGIAVVVALLLIADGLTRQMTNVMSSGGAEVTLIQEGIADTSFSALDEELRPNFLVVNVSGWPSPVPWPMNRACFWPMNRPGTWTWPAERR